MQRFSAIADRLRPGDKPEAKVGRDEAVAVTGVPWD
jgi:hypothetical protein